MPKSEQIPRARIDPDGLDFETLRKEGIGKIQDLCGETWTDYNLHDPGVTILEQLCYGLTDLSYHSGFAVQDYLACESSAINFQQQALYPPKGIFPSSAVTKTDYQKILYDAIPEINYVWLEPTIDKSKGKSKSLYTVFVKLDKKSMQSRLGNKKQKNSLSEQAVALERIHGVSERIRTSLDRLGAVLDEQNKYLETGHGVAIDMGPAAQVDEQRSDQISILRKMDAVLTSMGSVWCRINNIWSDIMDSPSDSDLNVRLDEILSVFDSALSSILPAVESRASNEDASGSALPNQLMPPLLQFESSLSELKRLLSELDKLQRTGNGMTSETGTSAEADGRLDEFVVIKRVLSVFAAHRGLCEDIDHVKIIHTVPYFLAGEIEIQPSYNRAKIYADIFLRCAHYISSGIQVDRYETILRQAGNYEQIFTGPLTRHGFISDQYFDEADGIISVVDLITLVSRIEGVIKVHDLYLIDQNNKKHTSISYDLPQHIFPDLNFPQSLKPQQILRLVLSQDVSHNSDKQSPDFKLYDSPQDEVLLEETHLEIRKLIFEYHAFRNNRPSFAHLIPLPKGEQQVATKYYSTQNHFPAVYGINRYGIPHSKPPEIKAKVKQLKAYLFPFEQMMANYLQNVKEIPRLFSLDTELKQSYFSQFLDNDNIPNIESLYVKDVHYSQSELSKILLHHDRFCDRRNRVLDTLLAMYGEQYPHSELQQFDCYRRFNPCQWMIENKINFLRYIKKVTRDRGKGFNYLKPVLQSHNGENAENLAGAHQRISLLLGLTHFDRISWITDVLTKRSSRLVPDRIIMKSMQLLPAEMADNAIPLVIDEEKFTEVAIPFKLPPFSYAVFKAGIDIKNYRLVSSNEETIVCLKSNLHARLWPLGHKRDQDEAIEYAYNYCSVLSQLNSACESFHLIEHVLLRPRGKKKSFAAIPESETFFDFRISVLFPSWTARFSNAAFRKFAEEMVVKNLPAHIVPEFYWLDFVYMQDFEQRYKNWLSCLQQSYGNQCQDEFERLNSASEKLVTFLLKNKSKVAGEYWL